MKMNTDEVRVAPALLDNGIDHKASVDEFIADVGGEGEDGEVAPRAAVNARLNLERELNDQDLAKIAADFSERYRRTAVRYTGDMNEIPQRLLMPSVHDANLWQVRVKVRMPSAATMYRVSLSRPRSLVKREISYSVSCVKQSTSNSPIGHSVFSLHSSETPYQE